jgi:hypothetical protein
LSNGKGLIILSLIFGIAGTGIAGYTLITTFSTSEVSVKTPVVQNYWYKENFGSLPVGQFQYKTINPLYINITVNSGEDIYVSYSGYAEFNPGGSDLRINIYINENQTSLATRFEIPNPASTVRYPFAVQGIIEDVTPGIYNISVRAYAFDLLTEIWRSNLYIHTLK